MKAKRKTAPTLTQSQNKEAEEKNRRLKVHRQIWMRVAAIFLIVVFLASECATLMP